MRIDGLTGPAKVDAWLDVFILKTEAQIVRQSRVIVSEKVAEILHDNKSVVICFDEPVCIVFVVLPNVLQTFLGLGPKPVPILFNPV